jgi:hypothetical protein
VASIRNILRRSALTALTLLSLAGTANAQNAGFRTTAVPGDMPMTVALFYATAAAALTISMDPWQGPRR